MHITLIQFRFLAMIFDEKILRQVAHQNKPYLHRLYIAVGFFFKLKNQIKLFLLKNQSQNKPNKTVMIFDWSTFNVTASPISRMPV
jgi:hypothetical protein